MRNWSRRSGRLVRLEEGQDPPGPISPTNKPIRANPWGGFMPYHSFPNATCPGASRSATALKCRLLDEVFILEWLLRCCDTSNLTHVCLTVRAAPGKVVLLKEFRLSLGALGSSTYDLIEETAVVHAAEYLQLARRFLSQKHDVTLALPLR